MSYQKWVILTCKQRKLPPICGCLFSSCEYQQCCLFDLIKVNIFIDIANKLYYKNISLNDDKYSIDGLSVFFVVDLN